MQFPPSLASLRAWYEAELSALCATWPNESRIPLKLARAMSYAMQGAGKRVRPVLVLSTYRLFRDDAQPAMPVAHALELVHTYSLVHDDLPALDNDDLRRGRPTLHRVFDEATAILAGDALLTEAFRLIGLLGFDAAAEAGGSGDALPTGTTTPAVGALVALLADAAGARGMVGGQMLDLDATGRSDLDTSSLERMHAMKTGALIQASAVAGALAAGADSAACERLRRFGRRLGLLFQITDDILDASSSTERLGKTAGKDAAQGKTTFVTRLGLASASRHASHVAGEALDLLTPFGARGRPLRDLVEYTLEREN